MAMQDVIRQTYIHIFSPNKILKHIKLLLEISRFKKSEIKYCSQQIFQVS